jgi:hypothetical protein
MLSSEGTKWDAGLWVGTQKVRSSDRDQDQDQAWSTIRAPDEKTSELALDIIRGGVQLAICEGQRRLQGLFWQATKTQRLNSP